jgi:hypothetical protein
VALVDDSAGPASAGARTSCCSRECGGGLGIALIAHRVDRGRRVHEDRSAAPGANQELFATGLANAGGGLGGMPGRRNVADGVNPGPAPLARCPGLSAASTLAVLLFLAPLIA